VALAAWWFEGRGQPGAAGWPLDAIVIACVVVLNAVLGWLQEAKAAQAVAALAKMTTATSAVLRDGAVARVPSAELVKGDLLVLAEGDAVGADARLAQAAALMLLEAPLTGESEAVLKDAARLPAVAALGDRLNMVFKGTAVAQGTGHAIVTATGMQTEMGGIATCWTPRPTRRRRCRSRSRIWARCWASQRWRSPPSWWPPSCSSRTSRAWPMSSRCCCWGCRWPWPPCPRACRRSCRWCWRWACAAWRATTPSSRSWPRSRRSGRRRSSRRTRPAR
jgi:hypothetical protein